jgi:uncharacterized protein GlcG (DUF336 family)
MKRSIRFGYMLTGVVLAGAIGLTLNALPTATAQHSHDDHANHAAEAVESHHESDAESPAAAPIYAGDISAHQAHAIMSAAVNKAAEIDTKMDIAIVDAGGNLKAFLRMDGAWLGSIDIAIKKAKTARHFDMNTGVIGELSQPGGPLYNIEHSNGGLITFPGGIPIKDGEGSIIGAIGVSGSSVENDHTVAQAGADAAN